MLMVGGISPAMFLRCTRLALVVIDLQLLDLASQCVASPAEPLRGFHTVSAGVGERAQYQRAFEFLFQPAAHGTLTSGERLRELAIERLLPTGLIFPLAGAADRA